MQLEATLPQLPQRSHVSIVCMFRLPVLTDHVLSGDASMTLDGTRLVVSNMRSGFDIYDAATGRAVGTLKHPVNQVRAIPVRFVHGGNAILGGSTVGAAHLWDVTELRMHPPLVVQGVSVCCAVLWTHTYALLLS